MILTIRGRPSAKTVPDTNRDWRSVSEARLSWRNRIVEALERDLFLLYAQPIRSLKQEQVREYEDKDGNVRTSVEVVASKVRFLGRGNNHGEEKRPVPGQPKAMGAQPSAPADDFNQSGDDVLKRVSYSDR